MSRAWDFRWVDFVDYQNQLDELIEAVRAR